MRFPVVLLALLSVLLGAVAAPSAAAQDFIAPHEDLEFDRPEAWALNYFASVTLLTGFGPPEVLQPGSLTASVELGWIPSLDAEQRTVGFGGLKEEDLNKAPIFFRPRLTVGLPKRFSLTLAWVPPVEVFGIKSNLGAVAIGRPLWEGERWRLGARLYAQTGTSEGAFTCTEEDAAYGDDFVNNPFGCEAASSDQATLRYAGVELSTAYEIRPGGVRLHAAGAVNTFDNRFQVNARTFGFRDRTLLSTDGSTWSLAAGFTVPFHERFDLGFDALYAPLDVTRPGKRRENDPLVNVRSILSYRLR